MTLPFHMLRLPSAIFCLVLFASPETGSAGVALKFTDGDSMVSVAPGGTFQFDVYLSVTGAEQVVGFDYYLLGAGATYESDFSILSRASDTSLFSELNTSDADVVYPVADAMLGPMNARSLGAFVPDLDAPVSGPGSYLIATFTIQVSSFAEIGAYSISSAVSSWIDQDFSESAFGDEAHFTVNVVPEPSSLLLALAGLGMIGFRNRRSPT